MQDSDPGRLFREHLFEGDLVQLPPPEEGFPDMLPSWFEGPLPALVYPPLAGRGFEEGEAFQLEITPYHIYYGSLREIAETADAGRAELLKRLVREWNPQAALEVCAIARSRLEEEDVEQALLHYELAIELDDTLYQAMQDGGMCQYVLSTLAGHDAEERLAAAEEMFRRAIELGPEEGLSWWSLARTLHDRGDPAGAGETLRRFLREHPEGRDRELVEQALREGFEEVSRRNGHAGETDPDEVLFEEARQLAFGDDPARAVEILRPLADRQPDVPQLWFVLGAAARRAGDLDEAERCLRRAARLAPQEPFVWMELGRACMAGEHWRPAEDAFRRALELDPENAGFLADLGRVLLAQGDREAAGEAIHLALELVPDDPEVIDAARLLEAG